MGADMISICIPVYNRGNLIPAVISSVLEQTYEDWELIIVDDGSEDSTVRVYRISGSIDNIVILK